MTRYLISFGAYAMDHIPGEDMPAVAKAAHAVVQEAINAGVLVCTGGLEDQRAGIVATDGTVADGPYPEAIGGLTVIEVPSRQEALEWAARIAVACRCAQEVRRSGPTPNSTRCSARQTGDGDVNLPGSEEPGPTSFPEPGLAIPRSARRESDPRNRQASPEADPSTISWA